MSKKEIVSDPQKCTGCKRCELICSYEHEKEYNHSKSRIRIIHFEENLLGIPTYCVDCEEKPCQDVCPTGAIKISEQGVSVVDSDLCIGCKQCVFACPFGAASFDEEKGVAFQCDLCDGDPQCVEQCPEDALEFTEIDEAVMKKKRKYINNAVDEGGLK
mgnify:CR=1 FL=1